MSRRLLCAGLLLGALAWPAADCPAGATGGPLDQAVLAAAEECSMTGTVQPLGPSIFMQGTHRLVDAEGQVLALLSAGDPGVDLNRYLGKRVTVRGPVERTVEGNMRLIRVREVQAAK